MKQLLLIPIGIVAIAALGWGVTYMNLGHKQHFDKKFADVDRETHEQTQSYVHGKTQDLAKYFEEYTKAEDFSDKEAIKNLVNMNFADFDETNIRNATLKQFLIDCRGY